MPDEPQTPEGAPVDVDRAPRKRLAVILPYVVTAVVAVMLSLAAQALLFPRPPVAPTAPTAALVSTAPPTATAAPASTAPQIATPAAAEGVLRLDILDLKEEDRRIWGALYLLRAASQIDDALVALEVNDLDEADRTLLTAYRSLDRAYTFSAEQEKGPINTFRMGLSQIRDDLRLRPEGADRRLRQLRRLILSLVDEGG